MHFGKVLYHTHILNKGMNMVKYVKNETPRRAYTVSRKICSALCVVYKAQKDQITELPRLANLDLFRMIYTYFNDLVLDNRTSSIVSVVSFISGM